MKGKSEDINIHRLESGTGELPKEGPSESAVETKGQLLRWNHERGFGFIKPEEEEDDVFAHVSALADGEGSVKEGDLVSFMKDWNERKQSYQAYDVTYVGEGPPLYPEEGDEGEEVAEGEESNAEEEVAA